MAAPVPQEEAREVVKILVKTIEKEFPKFNISEIKEGGSLGNRTVVLSNYDIDLVIYSRDITGEVLAEGAEMFTKWLIPLQDFIEKKISLKTKKRKHSVQFRFRDLIDVDLLLSPYWKDQHEFYTFLKRIPRRQCDGFSVCACKWQQGFFRDVPEKDKVKEYTKAWRNEQWPEGSNRLGRPSSYLMSLLVIAAHKKKPHDVTSALKDLVSKPDKKFNICWEDFYTRRDYHTLLPSRPRIVDPANPANNVWKSGFGLGERVSEERRAFREKIRFINLD